MKLETVFALDYQDRFSVESGRDFPRIAWSDAPAALCLDGEEIWGLSKEMILEDAFDDCDILRDVLIREMPGKDVVTSLFAAEAGEGHYDLSPRNRHFIDLLNHIEIDPENWDWDDLRHATRSGKVSPVVLSLALQGEEWR